MKMTEEQREYIHGGLAKAIREIDRIQAHGPLNCIPELEKLCREMLPVIHEINILLEQQTE